MSRSRNNLLRGQQNHASNQTQIGGGWIGYLERRALEEPGERTSLLAGPLLSEKPSYKAPPWVVVGEEEVEGQTLLNRGTTIKLPVFGDKDGKPYDMEYQPLIRQLHLLTTDPSYASIFEYLRSQGAQQAADLKKSWSPTGMEQYLLKTGHGLRAMDILEQGRVKPIPTEDENASHTRSAWGSTVKLPVKYSDFLAALNVVHEAEHVENPDQSEDIAENIFEEYRAVYKEIETYRDLKSQGLFPLNKRTKENYEYLERKYDLDNHNDDLAKFVFDYYLSRYGNNVSEEEQAIIYNRFLNMINKFRKGGL